MYKNDNIIVHAAQYHLHHICLNSIFLGPEINHQ